MDEKTADQTGQFSPRVRFGPRDTQTMPVEWAEIMLRELCERNRKLFGDLLASAAIDGRNGRQP